ncbi:YDG domain-containing protein [Parabacteroides sp. ASD2025]|uniref:YDG domain-containing protein n=1 Tax=Parabacteroides sp. ASD2025 TaxID=3415987 RepID=UPI003CF159A1
MKRRLLMLLSVFMTITSVGWMQAQKISYYGVGNIDGGTGTDQDPFIMTSLDAVLTAANANTESDSIVINLSDGEYEVLSGASFSITKSGVSIIGTDSNKVIIKSPFDIILSTEGNVSFASLQIAAKTATGRGLVDIKSSNTTVSFKDTKLDIEEAGTGDGGSTACFGIVSQLEVDNNTVNFITSRMYMSKGYQRGLCFRDGAGHTLNMENSKIDGPSGASGYPYVIGIGSWPGATSVTKPVTYNIKNSVVDVNYYAVFTNNQETPAVPVVINIEGSDITAWSALFLRGDLAKAAFPHTVKISDTRLNGRCYNNGPTDGFGTIVLDNCQQMDLVMDSKCRITATHKNIQSSVNTYMAVADVRKKTKGTWTFLPVSGDTCLIQSNNDVYTPTIFVLESETALTIKGIENVKFQSEGGKPCITVYKADGSFRNAATDVTTLLTKVSISDGDKVVFPEGTFTFPQKFVLDKSLTIEGAGKDKTTLIGTVQVTATDGAKVNFNNLHLSATSTAAHAIGVGTDKGSESPDITITDCVIDNADNGVRLMGAGAKLTLKNTDITARYYGVSVRNQRQTVSVDGGTIKGWAAIMTSAGGLTTGDGTMASTGTSIDIKNATLKSATISNEEYGVVVLQEKYNGVVLSIDGSTLEATDDNKGTNEAGVSALSALDIRSYGNKVTVKGSNLSSLYGENYHKLGENILHAAIISLGWHGSDDKSALADNTIEITNSQLNGKTGESLVYSYRDKAEKAYDKLTINGKTYDPASGLICYGEQDLQSKIDHAIAGETILLPVGEYKLSKQLTIKEAITLQGTITDKDSTILIAADDWSGSDGSSKHLVSIQVNKATLKNLVIDGLKSPEGGSGSGINVYTSTGVTLDNVISRNNKAAGLIVNGSTVTATNFRTSGNDWYGVNVDKGQDVISDPVFTIGAGCSFDEPIAILSDVADAPANYVVGNGWFKTKQDGASVWINGATSGLNFAITSVPSSVIYGQANLPLLTNVDSAYYKANKVNITVDNKAVAKIENDSLQILKPGKAILTLSVGDTAVTQSLDVLKKTLTITGITATTRPYNGSQEVNLVTTDMQVNGLVGDHTSENVITAPTKGEALSANAGVQPVTVTATLKDSYGDYYELADITGVMDTIKKVKLTYKTATPDAIEFGKVSTKTFTADLADKTNFVNSEDASVLGGTLQFDCPATDASLAGKYPVMPYGYTSNNYEIFYKADSLQVNAVAPKAEITAVTVNGVGDQASISVVGRILSNGGTPTDQLKATITPKTNGSGTETTGTTVDVAKDGTFKAEDIALTATKYTVELKVAANESLVSEPVTSGEVDLGAKLQNVNFTSVPVRMTYGSTAGIAAVSTEADAKLAYTITGEAIKFNSDSTEVEAVKAGEATVTITATKAEYVTAIAKQTIKVEPKLVTVKAVAENKLYDGKLDAKVTFTAEGILEKDASSITLSATNVTGAFTDKNASESAKTIILKGKCSLNNNTAGNYVLAQPANPTAKISKAKITAISASDVQRSYKTTSLSYKLNVEGLLGDEPIGTPGLYTGTIRVIEKSGKYTIDMAGVAFRNYDYAGVQPIGGDVNIIKGVPTLVTYNTEGNAGAAGMVVDNGGWENLGTPEIADATENGKVFAKLVYPDGTVTGNIINKEQTAPEVTINLADVASASLYSRKAPMTKAADGQLGYSEEKVLNITVAGTYTVESITPSVITVYKKDDDKYYIKGTGVGTGAILIKVGDAVASKTIDVVPATLKVTAAGQNKEYDGTTTANIALQLDAAEGASLDLEGVSFNYASKDAGNRDILPSKDIILKGNNADNYKLETISLSGKISPRTLTVTSQVSKYYDGTKTIDLTDYSATGLLTEEAAPIVTATFTNDANVGLDKVIELALKGNNSNYVLAKDGNTAKGNISKSTLEATLPEKATDAINLKNNITYVIRESGETVKANAGINQYVTVTGSNPFSVKATDNENCVIIVNNGAVTKSDPVTPPDGGGDVDETVTISLDATTKVLPRLEEFVLKATVSPSGKTVTWSSSDPTVASVTADGNKATVKGLKVGTTTITAKIGDVTATCEVTVDFATGLEEALANTEVFGRKGNIYVNPLQPLQVTVVNMIGKIVYNARISGNTQIPVTKGIYIVKLTNAGNTNVTKVSVY